jgi:hypothetical protein
MKRIITFVICISLILFWLDPHIVAWVMNDIIPESEKWSKLVTLGVWFVLLWASLGISLVFSLIISTLVGAITGEI